MKVFIDTSAFVALFVSSERKHKAIVGKYKEYVQQNAFFFTNYFVLAELYTRLLYYFDKKQCGKIVKKINNLDKEGRLAILDVDVIAFREAQEVFLKFAEHKLSITDATIYVCFKRFKLDEIFTLDSDFTKVYIPTARLS